MKLELAVLAQSIERMEIELQRCRACLTDLLAESVQSTCAPILIPPPIASPHRKRTRLYASGELSRTVLSILSGVDEMALPDLLRVLQTNKPGTQMASLRPCLTNLVQDGELIRVCKGVYRVVERKPHLAVMPS